MVGSDTIWQAEMEGAELPNVITNEEYCLVTSVVSTNTHLHAHTRTQSPTTIHIGLVYYWPHDWLLSRLSKRGSKKASIHNRHA